MHARTAFWAALCICAVAQAGPATTQPTISPATQPAATQPIAPSRPTTGQVRGPGRLGKVIVTSDLEEARDKIAPSLGAVTYTVGPDQIQTTPGGENAPFQQVLLRAPGVVQDSFGQEHVRGEHANLTYRVNGVLLPEPLNGFGQELDTRLVRSVTLIDGSLPAQFGFHTAGIVDVTTKSGDTLKGNEISFYGGSYDWFQPSVQFGGTSGKLDYFITSSYTHNDLGVENPTGSHRPLHDYTNQQRFFGYFSYRIDDTSRLSLLLNASNSDFEIPNTPHLTPAFTLANHPAFNSANLDENQNEQEYYAVVSYQKTIDQLSFQLSGFTRYGQIRFVPDPVGDLLFQGVSSRVFNNFVTNGVQLDSSYVLNDQHTIRFGAIADYTQEGIDTTTGVFPLDVNGNPTSDFASTVKDDSGNHAWEAGLYLQDEWRLTPKLTLNYGLRYDRFNANFDNEGQLSPRANLVWKADELTTFHAGYSRYFVPPPVQNVTTKTVDKFAGTTNEPENFLADPPKVERSNYYDVGVSRKIGQPLTVNLDGFYKQATNLVDLGQFGEAIIETPFNYRHATVYGAELSATYKQGGFSAFGNFSWVKTMGHGIDSQQFQIDNDELAFIANHNIKLDHESEFTASAGVSYQWPHDRVYADILYGSGLRGGFANTHQLQQHYPVNIGYEHVWHPKGDEKRAVRLRADLVNLFDEKYVIRDGSGIGVGAPQFGERRALFVGVTYAF
jgi:outer membrane receptor protein involved in Fe transport